MKIGLFSVESVLSLTYLRHATKGVFTGVVWEGGTTTTFGQGANLRGKETSKVASKEGKRSASTFALWLSSRARELHLLSWYYNTYH